MTSPPVPLHCPHHGTPLDLDPVDGVYVCPLGCRFPVTGGIPRFVDHEGYASGFGLQWTTYRRTQLDSHTHTSISRDRLERCLGGRLDELRGATVLEVGCGAGRFTEVLLAAGAKVFACDLSVAVEANLENCGEHDRHFVCQADVEHLPVAEGSFDVVICLGVVQHTPNPEHTIDVLCRQARPGGLVVLDHYAPAQSIPSSRVALRRLFLRLSPRKALAATRALVAMLWPVHRVLWAAAGWVPGAGRAYNLLRRLSPVMDYQRDLPQLTRRAVRDWAVLDTHDTLTDHYKHVRTPKQIETALCAAGMVDVVSELGGNGVEARARRPSRTEAAQRSECGSVESAIDRDSKR